MMIDAILTTLIIIIYAALEVSLGFLYKHINWHIGLSAALGLFVSFAIFELL
jgi:hypothetical protein